MDVIYLTVDQVTDLHAEAITTFGGIGGLRSQDLLESAVLQPQQSAFGDDAYLSFSSKGAAYAYFLALNHPFVDGNKRTAAAAMLTFLDINGFRINESDEDLEEVIVRLASKDISKDDFFLWAANAVKPHIEGG